MSGDEPFLLRWSRRKRDASTSTDGEKHPSQNAAESAETVSAAAADTSPPKPLPPVEAIGSASDLQAFLAPGVPLELTRAALRRVWTTDPAIRDFIGLSENAWDFNAPDGVPGFGGLAVEEARRLLAQILEYTQLPDPSPAAAPDDKTARPAKAASAILALRENASAVQYENDDDKRGEIPPRPRHGGALPQ